MTFNKYSLAGIATLSLSFIRDTEKSALSLSLGIEIDGCACSHPDNNSRYQRNQQQSYIASSKYRRLFLSPVELSIVRVFSSPSFLFHDFYFFYFLPCLLFFFIPVPRVRVICHFHSTKIHNTTREL